MYINFFDTPTTVRSGKTRRAIIDSVPQHSTDYLAFGYDYFDNPHLGVGYGGYQYDGRYAGAALAMCKHYGLREGDRVLEVGCAKGYVLVEFYRLGMDVVGLDTSAYAVELAHSDLGECVQVGDVCELPFDSGTFDLVFGKEVLPHIPEARVQKAILECMRVSKGAVFFEIQCGNTSVELEYMSRWDPTHKIFRTPDEWDNLFRELGFNGDVHYKVLIPEN